MMLHTENTSSMYKSFFGNTPEHNMDVFISGEVDPLKTAVIDVTLPAILAGKLSLGEVMAHPDVPRDAVYGYRLAMLSPALSFVIASNEFEPHAEGAMPPRLHLKWEPKRDDKGEVTDGMVAVATGAKPTYQKTLTCPHCKHDWPTDV